jgi:hypothetical protein
MDKLTFKEALSVIWALWWRSSILMFLFYGIGVGCFIGILKWINLLDDQPGWLFFLITWLVGLSSCIVIPAAVFQHIIAKKYKGFSLKIERHNV